MPITDGTDPIEDDEILYRRIPASTGWYNPDIDPFPSPEAFRPNSNDITGLSVYRQKYKTIDEVARGRAGKNYYVAALRSGDLKMHSIEVVPSPLEGDPGHAEISSLTYSNRNTDQALQWKVILAHKICLRVEGPFQSA